MGDYLSIRDLQRASSKMIESLPGRTMIKSGHRVIGYLTPVKKPDLEKLKAALDEISKLNEGHDIEADLDRYEALYGPIDRTVWTEEMVREIQAPFRRDK
jgi:hypothetical protein